MGGSLASWPTSCAIVVSAGVLVVIGANPSRSRWVLLFYGSVVDFLILMGDESPGREVSAQLEVQPEAVAAEIPAEVQPEAAVIAAIVADEVPADLMVDDYAGCEKLEALEGFRGLTVIQRKILYEHVRHPELNKNELAVRLGVARNTVYRFTAGDVYERMVTELARLEKRDLLHLALRALRRCLLSENEDVRFRTALRVLADAGVLAEAPRAARTQNTLIVKWAGDAGKRDGLAAAAIPLAENGSLLGDVMT